MIHSIVPNWVNGSISRPRGQSRCPESLKERTVRYTRMLLGLPFALTLCAFTVAGLKRAFAYDDPIAAVTQATHYLDGLRGLPREEVRGFTVGSDRDGRLVDPATRRTDDQSLTKRTF